MATALPPRQVFMVPGLRHAWHWLGMRPVSKQVMASILSSGGSVALCPGGVQVGPPHPPPSARLPCPASASALRR